MNFLTNCCNMYVGVDPFQCVYLFRIAVSFLSLFFPFFFAFQFTRNRQHIGPRYVHGNARAECVSVWIWRTLQWMRWILCSSNSEMPSKMCHLHTHINPRKIERKIIHAQHVIIMEKKGIKRFCAKKHEQRAYNFISLDEFCVEMKCGSPVD